MPKNQADKTADYRQGLRAIEAHPEPENPRRRAACAKDLLGFLKEYLASRFTLPFSGDHLRFIALLQKTILEGGQQATALPRGSGKTTILEGASTWALCYGHRQFLMVIASDAEAGNQIAASIKREFEDNDLLFEDFPEICHYVRALAGIARRAEGQSRVDGERTLLLWTKSEVRLPKFAAGGGSVIRVAGITGRIRGAKAPLADGSQVRPDLIFIDDPQTDESAKSVSQVQTRSKILHSTVLGLAGPGQAIAALAAVTIIEKGDLADQILDRNLHPEWQGHVGRLMRSMPTALRRWEEYAEIMREDLRAERGMKRATEFYRANRAEMDENADASWPERKHPSELSATQHAMNIMITRGEQAFMAEYQNAPVDLAARAATVSLTADQVAARVSGHAPGIVPVGAIELTAGIDVGQDLLHWWVQATGPGFAADCIAYGAYPEVGRNYFTSAECRGALARKHPAGSLPATWWAALSALCAQLMDRNWQGADGSSHRIGLALIDAGYGRSTDTIYDFAARSDWRDRILPSHGRGVTAKQSAMADWAKRPGDKLGRDWRVQVMRNRKAKGVIFDANAWKTFLADRLAAERGGSGCLNLPGSRAVEHRMVSEHLTAERRHQVTASGGRTSDEWVAIPGRDNHLLDAAILANVAASIRGIELDGVAPMRGRRPMHQPSPRSSPSSPPANPSPSTTPKAPRRVQRGPDGYAIQVS